MSLTNFQDISKAGSNLDAGFQFEFCCGNCSRKWKSPYKPYRRGQISGLIYKFAHFLNGRGGAFRASNALADAGEKGARQTALQEAIEVAEQRYTECPGCKRPVCEDCWSPQTQRCESCERKGEPRSAGGASVPAPSARDSVGVGNVSATLSCPNCQAAFGAGRFCAECGFDMASTHKSCPGCGAMCTRAARFCPDCGHGF